MDFGQHLKRSWGCFSSRWREAVVVSLVPYASLLLFPLLMMVVLAFFVALLAVILLVAYIIGGFVGQAGVFYWAVALVAFLFVATFMVFLAMFAVQIAVYFVVRSGVNPTLAQMMAGGRGGLPGYWQVMRDDWRRLVMTDALVNGPTLLVFGIPAIVSVALGFLGPLELCVTVPLFLTLFAANAVWLYLAEHATVLVRLDGLPPVAAIRESIAISKRRAMTLGPAFIAYAVLKVVTGEVTFVGPIACQAVAYPVWVLFNASVYVEERDAGKGARGIEPEYVVK